MSAIFILLEVGPSLLNTQTFYLHSIIGAVIYELKYHLADLGC
jgi:hypothetical protein